MTTIPFTVAGLLLAMSMAQAHAATPGTDCTAPAIAQASKLLALHTDNDNRASVIRVARPRPAIANPAFPRQKLAVWEVWGDVYKARYRMRFIYSGAGNTACTLVGQEILEYAKP